MASHTVNVSGIALSTTQAQLHDFFTFCGKITSISIEGEKSGKAIIAFEKPSAAKTALMLNGGTLDGATLSVTSEVVHHDEPHDVPGEGHPIEQTDKPRAGIAAEYLAKGYALSDHILQRAIDIDQTQGISKRFLTYFQSLDKSVGERALGPEQTISGKLQSTVASASQQARAVNEQKGYSKIAQDYYAKAVASPLGQKVWNFYTTTTKQVTDIHEEARRIAAEEKAKAASSSSPPTETPKETASAEPSSEKVQS